jgi:hypothetical protein
VILKRGGPNAAPFSRRYRAPYEYVLASTVLSSP